MKLIDKDALVEEIESKRKYAQTLGDNAINSSMQQFYDGMKQSCVDILSFIDTLEVKEVDLDVMQRMEECPYRQVGCTMYEGKILECKGACSWVVDYPKLKELKAQKGE
jgi:hypothetical protein